MGLRLASRQLGLAGHSSFLFCMAFLPPSNGLSLFWCRAGAQGEESHTGLEAWAQNFTFSLLRHSTGQRVPKSSWDQQTGHLHSTASPVVKGVVTGRKDRGTRVFYRPAQF